MLVRLRRTGREKEGFMRRVISGFVGVMCAVVSTAALAQGKPPLKLYFDDQSKLLVRIVRYAPSPLGAVPTQIDYGDYREADGLKIPFRWTVVQPDGIATTQLEQVQQNVPIDPARFTQPPGH